jgi:sulfite reductase (NADPH) flavoprotein alpha-component
MTIRDAPPANALMIPETAPFSVEQRAWLNGFFAACCRSTRRSRR